jgi:hypothetical protein
MKRDNAPNQLTFIDEVGKWDWLVGQKINVSVPPRYAHCRCYKQAATPEQMAQHVEDLLAGVCSTCRRRIQ